MKTDKFRAACSTLAALAFTIGPALAQETQQQPEVVVPIKERPTVQKTATGNITEVNEKAIFIKGAGDAHSTGYIITADTAYVDDDGTPAQKATAKIGHAVVISYVIQNDSRVALSVHVRNAP